MILKPKLITKIEPGHRFSKGLVGSWLFNEGGGDLAYDTSGNGNHGRLVGNVNSVAGKFGPALSFDGAGDYVDIPDPGIFALSSMTLNVWVFIPIGVDQIVWTTLVQKGSGLGDGELRYGLQFSNAGVNNLWMAVREGGSPFTTTSIEISTGIWHMITGTYNQSDLVIYLDGVVYNTNNIGSKTLPRNSDPVIIGRQKPSSSRYFEGSVDHVTIYNRALNAGEIKELNRDPFQMFKRNL